MHVYCTHHNTYCIMLSHVLSPSISYYYYYNYSYSIIHCMIVKHSQSLHLLHNHSITVSACFLVTLTHFWWYHCWQLSHCTILIPALYLLYRQISLGHVSLSMWASINLNYNEKGKLIHYVWAPSPPQNLEIREIVWWTVYFN